MNHANRNRATNKRLWIIGLKHTATYSFQIWFLYDHAYFITVWEEPALKCDWLSNFAHRGDHFIIQTGLAHSRRETLRKWIEANVSDVLLTCWANNFHHQQFYLAQLVPTVKLTMHSISIRQENDPRCPCVWSAENVQRCAKRKTITWKEIIAFSVKFNDHSLVDEHSALNAQFLIGSNYQMLVLIPDFTSILCFTCRKALLSYSCSVGCSLMNHTSWTLYDSKPSYMLMMSPLCRYFTVTWQVCGHAHLTLCPKHVIWTTQEGKRHPKSENTE